MMQSRCFRFLVMLALAWPACTRPESREKVEPAEAAHRKKQPVILISLDGYRFDYTERIHPPWLSRFAAEGTRAESMIPVYPSKTFPNHTSIITGVFPEKHGILSNRFYDPVSKRKFDYHKTTDDPSWFKAAPFWVTAEAQGLRTASVFWIGTDAGAGGRRPSYWLRYDGSLPSRARVEQILAWLALPAETRPSFLMLYFSKVDDAGHRYGPESSEVEAAIREIDGALGLLEAGAEKLGIKPRFIVVSDHGMLKVDASKNICLGDLIPKGEATIEFGGPQAFLYNVPAEKKNALVERLNQVPRLHAYARADIPASYRLRNFPAAGDVLVEIDPPGLLSECSLLKFNPVGMHGWNPLPYDSQRGIFYAKGPGIRRGTSVPSVENVNVVPLLIHLLGLKDPGGLDGRFENVSGFAVER